METNFHKFVAAQKMGKSLVISGHLWLEHLMVRSVVAVLPNPNALFRERSVSFHMLVSLCEAHGIIEIPLAGALRSVNALRNKCAHQANYNPTDSEMEGLQSSLQGVHQDAAAEAKPSGWEAGWNALETIAKLLEDRARTVGATDLDAILPSHDLSSVQQ
jgi:hypothetical protein